METPQHLSLRLTTDSLVRLRTSVGESTHELSLERDEFEQFFRHMLRIRAKLDLRDATGAYDKKYGFDRR